MSPLSQESKLAQLREVLMQSNSEFFLTLKERRSIAIKIQDMKGYGGRFSNFSPEREVEVFKLFIDELSALSLKELLSFSLIMEDHAAALAPGGYPAWSSFIHLGNHSHELHEMINPLMLKFSHPNIFNKLTLSLEFSFLKQL
jgi:hypothetical protein